jgi:hypothetical protein
MMGEGIVRAGLMACRSRGNMVSLQRMNGPVEALVIML